MFVFACENYFTQEARNVGVAHRYHMNLMPTHQPNSHNSDIFSAEHNFIDLIELNK